MSWLWPAGPDASAAAQGANPMGVVTSFNTRVGAVVATLNDYAASLVQNNSGVAGATVALALDALAALIATAQSTANAKLASFNGRTATAVVPTAGDYAASQVTNDSGQANTALTQGGTLASALDEMRLFTGETTQVGGFSSSVNSATPVFLGFMQQALSLAVARIPTAGSFLSRLTRTGLVTAGTAGSVAFLRSSGAMPFAGTDGYGLILRYGLSSLTTNMRHMVGVSAANIATNVDPNALLDIILLGATLGSGNLNLYTNDASGVATVIPLGANFPVAVGAVYELYVKVEAGAAAGYVVRVRRLDASVADFLQTITTNVPTTATFLGANMMNTNNTDAAVSSIELIDGHCYRKLAA